MSGLAHLALECGIRVTGSDKRENASIQKLRQLGVKVDKEQRGRFIDPASCLVYSGAILQDNFERLKARELHCLCMHRTQFLQKLTSDSLCISVTGSHGKSSTAALLAHILPYTSYAIGGKFLKNGQNAQWGESDFFVLELDESDRSFLSFFPTGALITNLEWEHVDVYPHLSLLKRDFSLFFKRLERRELFLWCMDDPGLRSLSPQGISYGFHPDADFRILHFWKEGTQVSFRCAQKDKVLAPFSTSLLGKMQIQNSAGAIAMALQLGVPEREIRDSLASFSGVEKRLEFLGTHQGALFFDDYAHHPTEIECTLSALKESHPQYSLVALFQPHRYSRLRYFFTAFIEAFQKADLLLVTQVYPAGESPIQKWGVKEWIREASCILPIPVISCTREEFFSQYASSPLSWGQMWVTLGAGDITFWGRELFFKRAE